MKRRAVGFLWTAGPPPLDNPDSRRRRKHLVQNSLYIPTRQPVDLNDDVLEFMLQAEHPLFTSLLEVEAETACPGRISRHTPITKVDSQFDQARLKLHNSRVSEDGLLDADQPTESAHREWLAAAYWRPSQPMNSLRSSVLPSVLSSDLKTPANADLHRST